MLRTILRILRCTPRRATFVALLIVTLQTSARAQTNEQVVAPMPTTPAQEAPTPYAGRWSMGAGVGASLYGGSDYGLLYNSLGSLGTSVPSGANWFGVALVEVTLMPSLRLGLNVTGAYARTHNADSDTMVGLAVPGDESVGELGAAASLRWVLNPGELVEVSPLIALGGGWFRGASVRGWTTGTDGVITSRRDVLAEGYRVGMRAGMAVEYRLLERMFLRLEAYFVRVDHTSFKQTQREVDIDAPTTESVRRLGMTGAGLSVQPALQIRILI